MHFSTNFCNDDKINFFPPFPRNLLKSTLFVVSHDDGVLKQSHSICSLSPQDESTRVNKLNPFKIDLTQPANFCSATILLRCAFKSDSISFFFTQCLKCTILTCLITFNEYYIMPSTLPSTYYLCLAAHFFLSKNNSMCNQYNYQ